MIKQILNEVLDSEGKFTIYGDVTISYFNLKHILELKVERKINEHTRLTFTGVINEAEKDRYIASTTVEKSITVSNKTKPLFQGIVKNIEIKSVNGVYHLYVEALSHTYKLDLVKRKRSFQCDSLNELHTYDQIIRQVIAPYDRAHIINFVGEEYKADPFILQYDETDWEFLKRMASRFHEGLVSAEDFDAPKVYFGVPINPDIKPLADANYTVEKRIDQWLTSSLHYHTAIDIDENDFIAYTVESVNVLKIGQCVSFNGQKLYVQESTSIIQESVIRNYSKLVKKVGLAQPFYANDKIVGLSLEGKVLDVKWHEIKVHLFIDKEQDKETGCWFLYSSMYTSGWDTGFYFMPEIDDKVRIYFPNEKEKNCIAISSYFDTTLEEPVIEDTKNKIYDLTRNRLADPNIKSIKTIYNKEIIFAPDRIIIHGEGMSISLLDNNGIEISTENDIFIQAREKIYMEAENIVLEGKDKIKLSCQQHSIDISQGKIAINGPRVRIN